MSTIHSFKDLIVWQKSMELVKEIYLLTQMLPTKETYGLASQMRRCAVSIPSNIAEGNKRSTRKDFMQFLRIASGSSAELETQILLVDSLYPSIKTGYAKSILLEIQKILSVMIKKLGSSQ